MPRVIGVLNQKGGVGKTTIALNLATAFALRGERVLLVDADPQGSALAWSSARAAEPLFPVVGMAKPSLHRDLDQLARPYDRVLVDGAPRVNELARSAILASDLVLIPVQPSPFDVWAAAETVRLIEEARQYRATLAAGFVISRRIGKTAIGRDVAAALAHHGLPVFGPALGQRVVCAESAAQGLSVLEMQPQGEAAREFAALADALAPREGARQAA